jgi:hypothetical protein
MNDGSRKIGGIRICAIYGWLGMGGKVLFCDPQRAEFTLLTSMPNHPTLLQLMRGFPPVQLLLLSLVFCLLTFPLASLTQGYGKAAASLEHRRHHHEDGEGMTMVKGGGEHPEGEHKHVEVPVFVRLRFAHTPLTVSLMQGDEELAEKLDLSASPVEFKTDMEVSHDGNELIVSATWAEGTPETALTIELEPDGFETRSETRWSSDSELNEVLTFTW